MSNWESDYWYPDSSLVFSPRLIRRSLKMDGTSQVLLVGNKIVMSNFKTFYRNSEGGLSALWSSNPDEKTEEELEKLKTLKDKCLANRKKKKKPMKPETKPAPKSETANKLMEKLSQNILDKVKQMSAKRRLNSMTLGKTYSTYAIKFSFRKTYPDLAYDCKLKKHIVRKFPPKDVFKVEERTPKPRPRFLSSSSGKKGNTFRKSKAETGPPIVLRLMPDFNKIDIFDRGLQDTQENKRKRFTSISQKLVEFQRKAKLIDEFINPVDFINPKKKSGKSPKPARRNPFDTFRLLKDDSKKSEDEVLKRQTNRRRGKGKNIPEKPEPIPEKTEEDKKKEREKILTDMCMTNPKWSHVIHYHNKIQKYGVHLDLDTLLHGMLSPTDYKELHEKCFGTGFPVPPPETDEEE